MVLIAAALTAQTHPPVIGATSLPTCDDTYEGRIFSIEDASSTADCDNTGGGDITAFCICEEDPSATFNWVVAGGGGGAALTVEEADASPSVSSVDTVQFDQADGFTVTDETGGQVQIDLTPRAGAAYSHATDCTSITTGVADDICVELDDETLYSCQPTAGGCDTAGEWILTGDGSGSGASAGGTGDVQYSSDGAGGFGAEAEFDYDAATNIMDVDYVQAADGINTCTADAISFGFQTETDWGLIHNDGQTQEAIKVCVNGSGEFGFFLGGPTLASDQAIRWSSSTVITGDNPATDLFMDRQAGGVLDIYTTGNDPGQLAFIGHTQSSDTIADSGDGNPATLTLTPTANVHRITCNDADGCDITLSDVTDGSIDNVFLAVLNISANAMNFDDSAGVQNVACAFSGGDQTSISFYRNTVDDEWYEVARSGSECAAGGTITVEEADASPSVSSVNTVQFDQADGFTVTDETGGQVQIDLSPRAGAAYSHATDCTAITTGVADDLCVELDSENLYSCQPTAGGCDTAGEWILTGGGGGSPGGSDTQVQYNDATAFGGDAGFLFDETNDELTLGQAGTQSGRYALADSSSNKTCMAQSGDRIFHDTDCDNTKDGGEEYIDQAPATSAGGPDSLLIVDEKSANSNGGASTSATWNQRTLNTTRWNTINGASLSSNEITLATGTYYIYASAPAYQADRHKLRLRDAGDTTTYVIGSSNFSTGTGNDATIATLQGEFTLGSSTALVLEHYTETGDGTRGLGVECNCTEVEVFAQVYIEDTNTGGGPGDDITVQSAFGNPDSPIFNDTATIGVTATDAAPDTVTWDVVDNSIDWPHIDYVTTLTSDPALNAEECWFSDSGTGSGGFACEGTVANANEQLYLFPAQDGADTIHTLVTEGLAQTLTNKTIDVESTGNDITTVEYLYFQVAECVGAAARLLWNDDATGLTAPTAACNDTGSFQSPSADFSGSAVNSFNMTLRIPPDWDSAEAVDVSLRYVISAASPTGNVEWDLETSSCKGAGQSWNSTFNAVQTITDAAAAQNVLNDADQASLTMTGCLADEDLVLRVSRDGTSDTNNDDAKLLSVRVTMRRKQ